MSYLAFPIIGGTYKGHMGIGTGVLWSVSSKRFHGVIFQNPQKKYWPQDIKRIKQIVSNDGKDFNGAAGVAAAGALFLGPVGAILGAIAGGNRTDQTYGIEFTDGAKVVVQITGVVGDAFEKTWRCLYLYARENGLIDVDF
ncbi:hypothetical protein [Jannaschia formosa]|uniref:hypothetical protein n=1 Tax=Jannaschia formosa TaxID=2259592 RepID=UPI000E1BE2D3|nr:hypothetical protein [Jannaschia formosa]TFL20271.1 hypothetical protein DR046_02725 [Jannaschia formosa]